MLVLPICIYYISSLYISTGILATYLYLAIKSCLLIIVPQSTYI